jgi:hypothetical protein
LAEGIVSSLINTRDAHGVRTLRKRLIIAYFFSAVDSDIAHMMAANAENKDVEKLAF